MFKRFIVLAALALSSVAVAHADSISGFFSSTGTESFTNSSITFSPGGAVVAGAIGGTFANYLTDGNPITFRSGALPYSQGQNSTPGGTPIQLFTTTQAGETFAFDLTSYNAGFISGAMGCDLGGTCLIVTGTGFFTGTGAVNFTDSPATFLFTSNYAPGEPLGSITSSSASASADPSADPSTDPPAVPEPASLALFGTGLLGVVGLARRKFSA